MEPETTSALERRRWLIGILISLAFGIFGAVMAVLSYSARAKEHATPPAAPAAEPPPPHGHGKGHKGQ